MFNQNQNKSIIDPQQIRDMIGVFQQYQDAYNEGDPSFSVDRLKCRYQDESIDRFLEQLQYHDKQMRRFIHDMMGKAVFTLNQVMKEWMNEKQQIFEYKSIVQQKNNEIQGYRDKIGTNLSQIAMFYEKLKIQNAQLVQKITQLHEQYRQQTKSIQKSFIQRQQSRIIQKSMFSQLYDNNQKLITTINQTKNQKNILEQQYRQLVNKHLKCDSIIQRLKQKIIYLQNDLVNNIQNQAKYFKQQSIDNREQRQQSVKGSFIESVQQKPKVKTKLSQQVVNYRISQIGNSFVKYQTARQIQSDMNQVKYQVSKLIRSDTGQFNIQIKQQESRFERKVPIDPYYSHYILTCQSVKIKEDCEDMLNIDMKPYYKQVIQKRIPMHLWDQWVKNRLRELTIINIE